MMIFLFDIAKQCGTRRKTLQAALAVGVAAFCPLVSAAAAPLASFVNLPPDSFAPKPVPTVQSLLSQVQANVLVRRRYAHYFHMPDSRLLAYLRANLVASHLSDEGRYTMFCVRPNGLVYPTVLNMPKGSRVFALRGGPAVLTCPEGNPLTRFQTAVEMHVVPPPVGTSAVPETASPRQIIIPAQPREIIVPAYVPTPVYQAVSPLTPAERAAEAPAASPAPSPTPAKP